VRLRQRAPFQDYISIEALLESKSKKKQVTLGASLFNTKPKSGLAFLEENGLIYADLSDNVTRASSLAKFLKSSTRLDKKLLGEFISRPENLELLKAFIEQFEFKGVSISVSH
jgi:brefeldin A-resistance guanine nucleotide exchange factor 1